MFQTKNWRIWKFWLGTKYRRNPRGKVAVKIIKHKNQRWRMEVAVLRSCQGALGFLTIPRYRAEEIPFVL
jgi:predicted acetyltransferase